MIENNGNVPLQLEWLFGRNSVSKSAVLLTEWVFEGDLVSKMADLLTETDGLPRFGREQGEKGRGAQQGDGSKLRRACHTRVLRKAQL